MVRRSALAAAGALALLTADVRARGPLSAWERDRLAPPPSGDAEPWPTLTRVGDRPGLVGFGLAAVVVAVVRHRAPLRPAAVLLGGVGVRRALARWVGRERPPQEWWLVEPDGTSFPSRHVTWAGLGLLALVRELPPAAARAVTPAAVAAVGVECYSRVRLGVHWPTDTLGAVLLLLALDGGTMPGDWSARCRSGRLESGDGARPAAPKRTR